jgi:hypothetical protein
MFSATNCKKVLGTPVRLEERLTMVLDRGQEVNVNETMLCLSPRRDDIEWSKRNGVVVEEAAK